MTNMTITERVYGSIPGYTEEARLQATLRPFRNAKNYARPTIAAEASALEEILTLLSNGEEIPENIADSLVIAEQQERSAERRALLMARVASENSSNLEGIISQGISTAYAQARAELATVMEEADKATDDLQGVNTAQDAIKAGRAATTAWLRLTTLATDYEEIRKIQGTLYKYDTTGSTVITTELLPRLSLFADSLDVTPHWIKARKDHGGNSTTNTTGSANYTQWLRGTIPADDNNHISAGCWPHPEFKAEHMLWISRIATPWIPTMEQLTTATRAATIATERHTGDNLQQQEQARDDYYSITGTTPRVAYTNQFTASDVEALRREEVSSAAKAQRKFDKKLGDAGSIAEYRREVAARRRMHDIARQR